MAYIDREKLLERLKFKRDTDNIDRKKYAGLECAIAQCLKAPTCDVVPRSEYSEVVNEYEQFIIDQINAKQKVAREIFGEIDGMCIDTFGNFNHRRFAELKKKHIGEKQDE